MSEVIQFNWQRRGQSVAVARGRALEAVAAYRAEEKKDELHSAGASNMSRIRLALGKVQLSVIVVAKSWLLTGGSAGASRIDNDFDIAPTGVRVDACANFLPHSEGFELGIIETEIAHEVGAHHGGASLR
jgi:hypothetical protein